MIGTFVKNDNWRRLFAKDSMTLMNARCDRALADLFQHVPLPAGVLGTIRRRMRQPGRHYHNLGHLAEMWRQHRKMARGTLRTRRVERLIASTIALHDAVYLAERSDNEAASAALWRQVASQWRRLPRGTVRQVATAIEATGRHTDPHAGATCEPWVQWVLDLDLSPIGLSPHRVQANGSRLRAEHRNLSAAAWQQRSKQFYGALQRREHIFHSPRLRSAFEGSARRYLRFALERMP
jgi:predicted metal-dependent HD superfamily phosphohydrolase